MGAVSHRRLPWHVERRRCHRGDPHLLPQGALELADRAVLVREELAQLVHIKFS